MVAGGDSGTGRCQHLKQVVEHMPVSKPTALTRENVEAASGPNGSLFVTVSSYTSGNQEALGSIAPCIDYLVGTRARETTSQRTRLRPAARSRDGTAARGGDSVN